jgi:hypothetical protein
MLRGNLCLVARVFIRAGVFFQSDFLNWRPAHAIEHNADLLFGRGKLLIKALLKALHRGEA